MVARVVYIILIIACLLCAAETLPYVNVIRDDLGAQSFAGLPQQTDPGIVLLTHVLGGFRGLLVDAVCVRAYHLQMDQNFWELYQLYDWMGKLEPRIEDIWVHNGWNMSYNLVAELQNGEARWQWIKRALAYMRDEGLKYNPQSGKIMEEISWVYYHKIGRDTDQYNVYYKTRLAQEMHKIFLNRAQQDIQAIANAPRTLEEFLADPEIASAFAGFQKSPPEPDLQYLTKAANIYDLPPSVAKRLRGSSRSVENKTRAFLQAHLLRDVLKMDHFEIMLDLERQFGKMDWRLPEPHAMYWARLGALYDTKPNRPITYDRLVIFSAQELWRRGTILSIPQSASDGYLLTSYDLGMIEPIERYYEMMLMKYSVVKDDYGASSVHDGHKVFLQEAVFNLYFAGFENEAARYFKLLYSFYPSDDMPASPEELALARVRLLVTEYGTRAKVMQFIDDLILRTCYCVVMNRANDARNFDNLCKRSWIAYEEFERGKQGDPAQVVALPSYEEYLASVMRTILSGNSAFPPELLPLLRKKLGVSEDIKPEDSEVKDFHIPETPSSSPLPK